MPFRSSYDTKAPVCASRQDRPVDVATHRRPWRFLKEAPDDRVGEPVGAMEARERGVGLIDGQTVEPVARPDPERPRAVLIQGIYLLRAECKRDALETEAAVLFSPAPQPLVIRPCPDLPRSVAENGRDHFGRVRNSGADRAPFDRLDVENAPKARSRKHTLVPGVEVVNEHHFVFRTAVRRAEARKSSRARIPLVQAADRSDPEAPKLVEGEGQDVGRRTGEGPVGLVRHPREPCV